MSDNLRMLGKYSAAMDAGDTEAVFEFWSEDFVSHVTERVSPERVGTDVRGNEQEWWQQVRSAFPDMTFTVNLLIESDDLVVSNWTVKGTHTGTPFFDVPPSGEPVEIMAYLGTSRLEEPINRHPVDFVFHGHAHHGALEGRTSTGIPVSTWEAEGAEVIETALDLLTRKE